jgi:pimeloyl-ACP methyl ester carboxylesterase
VKLFFRKYGEGEALIILHGVFGSSDNWMTVAKRLVANYSVYTIDARNHGLSPHDAAFDFDVMSEDLSEFINDNQISNPTLIGHSMGGKTIMTFANKYPDKIKGLVVVDIGPKSYEVQHRKLLDALLALDLNQIKTRQDAEQKLTESIPDISTRQFVLKNLYRKEDNQFGWRFNLQSLNTNIEKIGASQLSNHPFNKPTLFIRGEKSNYIKDEDWMDIQSVFPQATLCTVKDAGHWIHADNPDGFITCLTDFLTKY